MTMLYVWVSIMKIPTSYNTKLMIKDTVADAGEYVDTDHKLFHNEKKACVFVSHDIPQPFILKKKLKLDVKVEKEIHFFFENMAPICVHYNMIYHVEGHCPLMGKQAIKAIQKYKRNTIEPSLQLPTVKMAPQVLRNVLNTNFRFQSGISNPLIKPLSQAATTSKPRSPIIAKKKLFPETKLTNVLISKATAQTSTTYNTNGSESTSYPARKFCLKVIEANETEMETELTLKEREAISCPVKMLCLELGQT